MTTVMKSASPAAVWGRWGKVAQVVATVVFFLVVLGEGVHCYRSAHANTDSLDYVIIAESDHANLMAKALQECLAELPPKTSGCGDMVVHSGYNDEIAGYSEAELHEYLRLYRVKPLYCATLRGLVRQGHMDGMRALRTVNAASFVLVGVMLWVWLRVYLEPLAASVAGVLMLTFSQVVRMGQALTPDALACVFLLLALYLVLYPSNKGAPGARRRLWAGVAAFVLLVLTRPENILLVTIFGLAWIAWSGMQRQRMLVWAAVLVVAAAALNLGVGRFTHPVAWPAFFRTSFVELLPPERLSTATITLRDYVHAMLVTGPNSAAQYLPLPLLFAALALVSGRCPLELRRLLSVCGVVTVVRFVLYPTMDERFYTPFLLVTMVCAVVSAVKQGVGSRE
jgi:hypothetical protein